MKHWRLRVVVLLSAWFARRFVQLAQVNTADKSRRPAAPSGASVNYLLTPASRGYLVKKPTLLKPEGAPVSAGLRPGAGHCAPVQPAD